MTLLYYYKPFFRPNPWDKPPKEARKRRRKVVEIEPIVEIPPNFDAVDRGAKALIDSQRQDAIDEGAELRAAADAERDRLLKLQAKRLLEIEEMRAAEVLRAEEARLAKIAREEREFQEIADLHEFILMLEGYEQASS